MTAFCGGREKSDRGAQAYFRNAIRRKTSHCSERAPAAGILCVEESCPIKMRPKQHSPTPPAGASMEHQVQPSATLLCDSPAAASAQVIVVGGGGEKKIPQWCSVGALKVPDDEATPGSADACVCVRWFPHS